MLPSAAGTRREYLGDAGSLKPSLAASDYGAQAGTTGAHHHDVIEMILDGVGAAVDCGRFGVRGLAVR